MRQHLLHRREDRVGVDLECGAGPAEGLVGHAVAGVAQRPGAVDQAVQAAEVGDGIRHRQRHGALVGDVEHGGAVGRLHLDGGEVPRDRGGPPFAEQRNRGQADAGTRAGHRHDLSIEVCHVRSVHIECHVQPPWVPQTRAGRVVYLPFGRLL